MDWNSRARPAPAPWRVFTESGAAIEYQAGHSTFTQVRTHSAWRAVSGLRKSMRSTESKLGPWLAGSLESRPGAVHQMMNCLGRFGWLNSTCSSCPETTLHSSCEIIRALPSGAMMTLTSYHRTSTRARRFDPGLGPTE